MSNLVHLPRLRATGPRESGPCGKGPSGDQTLACIVAELAFGRNLAVEETSATQHVQVSPDQTSTRC